MSRLNLRLIAKNVTVQVLCRCSVFVNLRELNVLRDVAASLLVDHIITYLLTCELTLVTCIATWSLAFVLVLIHSLDEDFTYIDISHPP
jgi:hypothetical protein